MFQLLSHSTQKILVIEDNPADSRLIEILLETSDFNCEVTIQNSLAKGLQALSEDSYSVILLDLFLPDSRGLTTLETVLKGYPDANVIVLTGLSAKDTGIQTVKMGAQDFLVKGEFDTEQLVKSLVYSIERKDSLNRLEEAQQIALIGNWSYFFETKVFEGSDQLYRIFGYKPKSVDLTLSVLTNQIVQEDRYVVEEIYEVAKADNVASRDARIFTPDGELRYISILCKKIQENGEDRFSGIVQDITKRKLSEIAFLKTQQRFQVIFSQSKDAIFIASQDGTINTFNQATADLFNYTDLEGTEVRHLFKNPKRYDSLVQELKALNFVKDVEYRMLSKNGEIIPCLLTVNEMYTDDWFGYNFMIRDLRELKKAESLKKQKEFAERTALLREKFLANVSHEMRTPMNAILGMVNLMPKVNLNEEQVEYLQSIQQSGKYLLGIINDVLQISTLREEGRIEIRNEPFSIGHLVKSLNKIYTYQADKKGIKFSYELDPRIPQFLIGDELRLNQVLTNLINNAIKFTDFGFVKASVGLMQELEDEVLLRFAVEDSGIGIPNDKLDEIFEAFVRITDQNKLYPGTGLGLPIAKQLVKLQGGEISVRSSMGVGSTFVFQIVFPKNADVLAKNKDIISKDEQEELAIDNVRILLFEDHKMNQIVAKRTIEKEWTDAKVTIAENGKVGLDIYEKNDFDVILMDIQMPVMDGIETTKAIREMEGQRRNIPILAMTAHAHISENDKYRTYGMDDYVLKPFDPKDLFTKLAHHINRYVKTNKKEDFKMTTDKPEYINLSYMELMADGDTDMKKMMLELLFEDPLKEIGKMRKAIEEKDWDELKAVSHKMKSTLSFVGNDKITNANKLIERIAVDESDDQRLPELIDTVETIFDKALVELKAVHASL